MWQDDFLDYPMHYWDEGNPKNRKLRQQMRNGFRRITLRVKNNIEEQKESRLALAWCKANGNPHKKGGTMCI